MPQVLKRRPDTLFIAVGMKDNPIAERWIERLNVRTSVRLLGDQSRNQMAELFKIACISLSITEHDGLPNTLLESLACGAFPVVGDIESLREWIEHGVNGFLVPPGDPDAVAAAILRAIDDSELRRSAAAQNRAMIEARADHSKVMPLAEKFYSDVIASRNGIAVNA
jgi:glycosyltransferase involved in cell wall biosynthesis